VFDVKWKPPFRGHSRVVRVFFETTHDDQQYWRCVRGGRLSIEATAFGSEGSTAARRRAIAAMVASAGQLG
jgi:hypothetical protein